MAGIDLPSEEFPSTQEFTDTSLSNFPSDKEFCEINSAIPWKSVSYNTAYKLIETKEVFACKFGDSMILTLQSQDGVIIKAWATHLIREYMLKENNRHKELYIMSFGPKTAQKSKNSYYDFKIICM